MMKLILKNEIRSLCYAFGFMFLISCAAVPKQIVDAINKQDDEIKKVKEIYFKNMMSLTDLIENYQLEIIKIYEKQIIEKYSRSSDAKIIKTDDGQEARLVTLEPTGDPQVDKITLSELKIISDNFDERRALVKSNMNLMREEIKKADKNFETIQKINQSLKEYLDSLVRLKESQDKLAKKIKTTVTSVTGIPIPKFPSLPDPKSFEDLLSTKNN